MSKTRPPALFLDRDGVINEEVGYLFRTEDVRWVDGIFDLVRTAQRCGYKVVVVTNQSGIARELYTTEQFLELMDWMRAAFERQGAVLDAVYYCPFHPAHGVGEWKREHPDRKPEPGMLLRAERELGLDLSRSILVGDRCSDLQAAAAAGLRQAFLKSGTSGEDCAGDFTLVHELTDVAQWIEPQAEREDEEEGQF